jgi:hypothetical protein
VVRSKNHGNGVLSVEVVSRGSHGHGRHGAREAVGRRRRRHWEVQKCQGGVDESCRETPVSKAQLEELLQTVERVLQNPDLAKELLPPRPGFFFGSTDIDEYYMEG